MEWNEITWNKTAWGRECPEIILSSSPIDKSYVNTKVYIDTRV